MKRPLFTDMALAQPDSAIVVPRDATPINALVLTERLAVIFRDLAISAAAIDTIAGP